MKVTIQNGSRHGLARFEVEAMIPLFPRSWGRLVEQVVLYQGDGAGVTAAYFPKERLLGLYWPASGGIASKPDSILELLLSLSIVEERGELPAKPSRALRGRHLAAVREIFRGCMQVLEEMADARA